jgi:RNA polymerase sigma-70 factor (ECF subfamily)
MLGAPMNVPRDVVAHADERVFAGEEDAGVAALYDAHHEALRTFTRRLLGDADAAEDLVHDVFVAVPDALRRYRGDATLRTLLLSIAVNLSRKYVRAAARRRAALERAVMDGREASRTPEEDAQRAELAAALHSGLDALPLEQRVAFVLLEVEERSCADASQIVGVPEGTMRTRLFHAKRRLREILRKRGVA